MRASYESTPGFTRMTSPSEFRSYSRTPPNIICFILYGQISAAITDIPRAADLPCLRFEHAPSSPFGRDRYLAYTQSAFMASYGVASLVFGHLVHLYPPFKVLSVGLLSWCFAILVCGFAEPAKSYYLLLCGRCLSGVGEVCHAYKCTHIHAHVVRQGQLVPAHPAHDAGRLHFSASPPSSSTTRRHEGRRASGSRCSSRPRWLQPFTHILPLTLARLARWAPRRVMAMVRRWQVLRWDGHGVILLRYWCHVTPFRTK